MMRFSFLLLLLLSVSVSVSVSVSAVTNKCERVCPSNCGFNPDYQCVTNPITQCGECVNVKPTPTPKPVVCVANPCDAAVSSGACSRESCVPDYSVGCNFICNTPTPTTTGVQCLRNPCEDAARQGICPFESCTADYSKGCNFKCSIPTLNPTSTPTGVKCIVDPCLNAALQRICPFKSCTADYSTGCNFKCSKCRTTCDGVRCRGGTECVQDAECNIQCKPLPTNPPKPDICIQGGQVPPECKEDGQHEWDNKACKWQCKCRSNEGNWISIGERYKDKCNSCTCGANGASTCTKIGCDGLGVCFDDQGNGYNKGDTRKQDCNTCTCGSNGQWGCTKMAC